MSDRNVELKGRGALRQAGKGQAIQGLVRRVKEFQLYRAMESH